jgi:hypothetical protein
VDKQKRCEECHLEFLASLEEPEDNPLPAVDEYYCDLVDGGSDDDGEEVLL